MIVVLVGLSTTSLITHEGNCIHYICHKISSMEHFLPLAIASLAISLISIFLLDYFGPTTTQQTESDQASDSKDFKEDRSLAVDKVIDEERNMEMTADLLFPIWSAKSTKIFYKVHQLMSIN